MVEPAAQISQCQFGTCFKLFIDILVMIIKILGEIFMSMARIFIKKQPKDISGEIVLITGTGHGIGRELAMQYVEQGCEVICVDINDEENKKTVDEANSQRIGTAFFYHCDITNRKQVMSLADRIQQDIGNVSVIVNNAGIMYSHRLTKHTEKEIHQLFDVNVMSHFWVLEAFMPHLMAQRRGHIVALSSVAGIIGLPNLVPYSATKHAVRGLMEAISEEIRMDKSAIIETTTIYPFLVSTGLWKKSKVRFPSLLGVLTPRYAAECIIDAHRRNVRETGIPKFIFYLNNIFRCLPNRCALILRDFLDTGVESDS